MYPRNAASPPRIAIGAVVQISDGAVQSSGVTIKVIPEGGTEASGGGTTAYSADGIVLYTPTQAETNNPSFIVLAVKSGCAPASMTVITSASSTTGKTVVASIDNNVITAASIAADAITDAKVANDVTIASVTGNVGGNVAGSVASVASYGTLVSDIATAVWGAGTRSLTTFGTLASDVWSVATRTLTAASDSSGVTTLLSRILGTLAAGTHNAQSGDAFARLGAPAGASIAADIAGISGGGGGGLDAAGVRSAIGLASANLDTQLAAINSKTTNLPSDPADQSLVIAATDAILARLPAALVSGRMDVSVGAMASNVVTASAMATDAINEIRNGTSSITISRSGQTDVTYTEVRS